MRSLTTSVHHSQSQMCLHDIAILARRVKQSPVSVRAMQWAHWALIVAYTLGVVTPLCLRLLLQRCRTYLRQPAARRPAPVPSLPMTGRSDSSSERSMPIVETSSNSSSSARSCLSVEPPRPPRNEVWLCPLCDEPMAARRAHRGGMFLGCPAFPLCRGSRNMRDPTKASPVMEIRERARAAAQAQASR